MSEHWTIDPDELLAYLADEVGACDVRSGQLHNADWLFVRPNGCVRIRRYRIKRPIRASKEYVFAGIARLANRDLFWAEKRGRP
ncbi:hypothetical protein [Azospirillum brasilense]|uniref:hypothetical protein n=1 Tax=Azospirillum brasilense TaxID=192 RepID=UPI0011C463BC|nr:hypothetical protein [Azospirillum brasilense]NUB23346.1 hypothetical protein [Azospirillum brasilense]NUB30968.1 hypothetical protein [Azospirillum brasilense]